MGELDLMKICGAYSPTAEGYGAAALTVVYTWVPLAVAGLAIVRSDKVHATMRGAGPLRLLAWAAITILVAAMVMSLALAANVVDLIWPGGATPVASLVLLSVTLCVLAAMLALAVAGLIAWHRVLVALASRDGGHRMLV